jgi:release factor glutamine methyltransferase
MSAICHESLRTKSIRELIEFGQQLLLPYSDSAKLDCEVLLCFVVNKQRSYIYTWPEKQLNAAQVALYAQLLTRRLQGEPIAYITQNREFWSLPFTVSPATLIPRPDTEILVELVLTNHNVTQLRCLDLGTGTGAIALALASERKQWSIEAVDYSDDAVDLAKLNAKNLDLTQVNIYQSDWFSNVSLQSGFDVIVSNPPYIDAADHHLTEGDVRFEPKSALVAAEQGLADINNIAIQALDYFNETGFLYLEHGFEQAKAVQKVLADLGYCKIETFKDYADNDRITKACFIKSTNV